MFALDLIHTYSKYKCISTIEKKETTINKTQSLNFPMMCYLLGYQKIPMKSRCLFVTYQNLKGSRGVNVVAKPCIIMIVNLDVCLSETPSRATL